MALPKLTTVVAALILALGAGPALARDICTLVADPVSRNVLLADGDCESRVTPASTFKIPLAVIGFDAGLLLSRSEPVMTFKPGEPDWGGAPWKGDVDPSGWMRHSVVWYSQRLTRQLGAERLSDYLSKLGFGNADFYGDPGFNNGLERAWISSSLKISPLEQAGFVAALIEGQLPVSAAAMSGAISLVERAGTTEGWTLWGKTGSAYPRRADRSFDYAKGWGWYVGWAEKDGKRLVFARLAQDEARHEKSGGLRARDALLAEWPALVARLGL